jgi:hypothetical protein
MVMLHASLSTLVTSPVAQLASASDCYDRVQTQNCGIRRLVVQAHPEEGTWFFFVGVLFAVNPLAAWELADTGCRNSILPILSTYVGIDR